MISSGNLISFHEQRVFRVLVFRLTVQMESMRASKSSTAHMETASGAGTEEKETVLHTELKIAQEELDTMAKLNSRLGYEIKRNELALSNMMKNYDGRQQFARRLEADVNKVDSEEPAGNTSNTNCNNKSTTTAALNKIEVSDKSKVYLISKILSFWCFCAAQYLILPLKCILEL